MTDEQIQSISDGIQITSLKMSDVETGAVYLDEPNWGAERDAAFECTVHLPAAMLKCK